VGERKRLKVVVKRREEKRNEKFDRSGGASWAHGACAFLKQVFWFAGRSCLLDTVAERRDILRCL
jgi:hypothetical protein